MWVSLLLILGQMFLFCSNKIITPSSMILPLLDVVIGPISIVIQYVNPIITKRLMREKIRDVDRSRRSTKNPTTCPKACRSSYIPEDDYDADRYQCGYTGFRNLAHNYGIYRAGASGLRQDSNRDILCRNCLRIYAHGPAFFRESMGHFRLYRRCNYSDLVKRSRRASFITCVTRVETGLCGAASAANRQRSPARSSRSWSNRRATPSGILRICSHYDQTIRAAFPDWFGTIGDSMFTLFQVMTLESWSMGIVRPVMAVTHGHGLCLWHLSCFPVSQYLICLSQLLSILCRPFTILKNRKPSQT